MMMDILSTEGDIHEGEPLIHKVMVGGRRLGPQPTLHDIRAHARHELERLPAELRAFSPLMTYPVEVSGSLEELAVVADRRMGLPEVQS